MAKTSYNVSKPHSCFIWCRKSHVTKFSQNDKIPLCCIVHLVYFWKGNNACVLLIEYVLIGKHCLKPF